MVPLNAYGGPAICPMRLGGTNEPFLGNEYFVGRRKGFEPSTQLGPNGGWFAYCSVMETAYVAVPPSAVPASGPVGVSTT